MFSHTQIHFSDPVSTVDHPKINEWLSLVEGQMRLTLASSLARAVQDIKQFKDGDIDRQAYMHWCDRYQVGCPHRLITEECRVILENIFNSVIIAGSNCGAGSPDFVE